jgi:hypothetical protein
MVYGQQLAEHIWRALVGDAPAGPLAQHKRLAWKWQALVGDISPGQAQQATARSLQRHPYRAKHSTTQVL